MKTRWIGPAICERGMWIVRFRTALEVMHHEPGGIEILLPEEERLPLRERLRRLHAMQGRP